MLFRSAAKTAKTGKTRVLPSASDSGAALLKKKGYVRQIRRDQFSQCGIQSHSLRPHPPHNVRQQSQRTLELQHLAPSPRRLTNPALNLPLLCHLLLHAEACAICLTLATFRLFCKFWCTVQISVAEATLNHCTLSCATCTTSL